jgi:hypothetical protein
LSTTFLSFMLAWVDSSSSFFLFGKKWKAKKKEYKNTYDYVCFYQNITCLFWNRLNIDYNYTEKRWFIYNTKGVKFEREREKIFFFSYQQQEREVCRFFCVYYTLDSLLDWSALNEGVSDGLMMSWIFCVYDMRIKTRTQRSEDILFIKTFCYFTTKR